MIKNLRDGMTIDGEKFLVATCSKGVSVSGSSYLNIILQDASGTIEAKLWNAGEDDSILFTPGNLLLVDGDVLKFKDKLQLKISSASYIDPSFEDLTLYVPVSPFTLDELKEKYNKLHDKIKDKELLSVLDDLYKTHFEDIFNYPAAVRNHHAYSRGLITHALSVAEICDFFCDHYEGLNRDLMLVGALLHDIGKIVEFSSPLIPKYTTEGNLIGHIQIGYFAVSEACRKLKIDEQKRLLLEHIILSHHGHHEFGSPVLPMTREALLVSFADDIDAKENFIEKTLDDTVEGEFTNRLFQLDDRQLYKPKK